MTTLNLDYPQTMNEWADYWRDEIGVNVIPADTRNKRTWVQWSEFQKKPTPKELHEHWKRNNKFDNGMAIIAGKVWHSPKKQGLYLAFIDLDNQKAIDEFCTHKGATTPLEELAKHMIVEQHKDDLSRAHIYCYSTYPFVQKSSDITKSADSPAFEVKGSGEHGIAYCTPSPHKNGSNYEIIGTLQPELLDVLEGHIDSICKKYGIPYLGNGHSNKRSAKELFNSSDKVYEGHNRHGELLTEMCSLIRRNHEILPEETIKDLARKENERIYEPPLDETEFERQWKCAAKYIGTRYRMDRNQSKEKAPKTLEIELAELYKFKGLKDTEEIYYYDEDKGIFIKGAEWLIKQKCIEYDPEMRSRDVTEIINRIIWSNYIDREQLDSQIEWLATDSCMVNLETLETKEHSPEFLATVKIPHTYKAMPQTYEPLLSPDGNTLRELFSDSVADWEKTCKCPSPCPNIMQFLYQVMASEDVETVLDFMAYCLWRDFPFHKYLLFNGAGRNGKGVTTHLFKLLLGEQNVSGESLKRILETRFATAKLFGKMANIDADISKEELKHTGTLKILTGGDSIAGEFKFKDPFSFKNFAKLVFSANQIPKTPDETDAFFSRLIIINFPNQYLGDKADPHLKRKLTTEEEMSGLLSIVVARLPRVLSKGIYVSHSSIEENYVKYIQSSDPIRAFYESSIRKDNSNASKDEVYSAYSRFCKDKKLNSESCDTFNRRLKKDWGLLDSKLQKDGIRRPHWLGIKLTDNTEAEEGQETL